MRKRGNGTSGGGLAARIKAWEELNGSLIRARIKASGGLTYRCPGSQNPRKGGLGEKKKESS